MSDNGPQNQRNAPRITFGGPSDSTGSNQNGERSGARSKQRRPQGLPNNTASWFTALTQHGKEDLKFPRGQGVPITPIAVQNTKLATTEELPDEFVVVTVK